MGTSTVRSGGMMAEKLPDRPESNWAWAGVRFEGTLMTGGFCQVLLLPMARVGRKALMAWSRAMRAWT